MPGGLVRANSATNGRGQPYDPYSLSFVDSLTSVRGNHFLKAGGEVRADPDVDRPHRRHDLHVPERHGVPRQPGRRRSSISATSARRARSTTARPGSGTSSRITTSRFAQDEWHVAPKADAELRPALRLLHAADARRDNLIVKFNIDTGVIDPNTTPLYASKKNNFQPRVSFTYAPGKTVFRAGFGIFVGPGQTEDQIQPVESDRISSTLSNGAFPVDSGAAASPTSSTTRTTAATSRAPTRTSTRFPERIYQYTASVQQDLRRQHAGDGGVRRQPGPQPVPAQRRQPDHRGRHQPEPGEQRRSSSASSRSCSATPPATSPACRTRTPRSTTRPAAATTATTR